VPADPILESSRTTYFDISQETGTESGEPPGELKITEGPELNQKRRGESHGKERITTRGLDRIAIFYGRAQQPLRN
jgi:hypothetical protein